MKKFSLFLTLLLISTLTFSQIDIGFKANYGIGSIKRVGPAPNVQITPKFSPTFNIGTYLEKPVICFFSVGSELNYSRFSDNQSISYKTYDLTNNEVQYVQSDIKQSLSAISLPVYAKFTSGDMSFLLGPQVSYITAYTLEQQSVLTDSSGQRNHHNTNEKLKHNSLDFGFTLGLNFSFCSRFEAEARFYQSIRNAFETADPTIGSNQPTSFTLGLRYRVF